MHRIALSTLAYVIRAPWRGRYAAVTRPTSAPTRHAPSYTYSLKQLSRRTELGRAITESRQS